MNPTNAIRRVAALSVLALVLAACGATAPDLTGAQAVRIDDTWDGMSPVAPLASRFDLKLDGAQFSGTANFSIAGGRRTTSAEIAVPAEVMQAFLKKLAESYLREGTYEPRIDRTDDFPWINIEIDLGSEKVTFYSTSQGGSHVPWGATFGGKTYMIDSDTPFQALKILQPYLKSELLDQLIDQ